MTPTLFITGQVVTYEIVDSDDVSCPSEVISVSVPKCDEAFDSACTGSGAMPYERIKYDTRTGQSPNNPRKQVCVIHIETFNSYHNYEKV